VALLFYALWIVFSFCVVATVLVLYISFWIMVVLVAVVIEVGGAIIARRKPKTPRLPRGPHFGRPAPQARWSNRR